MNCKAQASFEVLLLVAFVFSVSLVIAGYFFAEADSLAIEAKSKAIILRELNKESGLFIVNEIKFDKQAGILNVCFSPRLPEAEKQIETALIAEAKITAVNAKFAASPSGQCSFP